MTGYLVELPVGDGGSGDGADSVQVEVRDVGGDGLVQVARPGQVVARASQTLGEVLGSVRPVAESFVHSVRGMAQAPDEMSVQFGVALNADAGVIITSTSAQANFSVSLVWRRTPASDSPTPDSPTQSPPTPNPPASDTSLR